MSTTSPTPVETLFETLHLSAYSPEEQEQLLLDISDTIFRGTLVRLIERMDDKTRAEFSALMDQDVDGDQITAFLKERVPGAEDVAADVVRELTADIATADTAATQEAS